MAMRFLITGGDALVARANLRGATPRPGAYSPPPTCGHHLAPLSAYTLGEDPHEAPAAGTQQARSALASLSSTHASLGLSLDSAKTEVMHFSRSRDAKRICATPITLYNALGPGQHFTAIPPKAIRWLGIWMDSQLLWNAHTQKMAAKAQSALTAMNLLSNTMRGITG